MPWVFENRGVKPTYDSFIPFKGLHERAVLVERKPGDPMLGVPRLGLVKQGEQFLGGKCFHRRAGVNEMEDDIPCYVEFIIGGLQ